MLFTIILDFDDGTYISQIDAASAGMALTAWIHKLIDSKDMALDSRQTLELAKEFDANSRTPVALADVRNVWCTTAVVQGKLALLNIVATVPDLENGEAQHEFKHAVQPEPKQPE